MHLLLRLSYNTIAGIMHEFPTNDSFSMELSNYNETVLINMWRDGIQSRHVIIHDVTLYHIVDKKMNDYLWHLGTPVHVSDVDRQHSRIAYHLA